MVQYLFDDRLQETSSSGLTNCSTVIWYCVTGMRSTINLTRTPFVCAIIHLDRPYCTQPLSRKYAPVLLMYTITYDPAYHDDIVLWLGCNQSQQREITIVLYKKKIICNHFVPIYKTPYHPHDCKLSTQRKLNKRKRYYIIVTSRGCYIPTAIVKWRLGRKQGTL